MHNLYYGLFLFLSFACTRRLQNQRPVIAPGTDSVKVNASATDSPSKKNSSAAGSNTAVKEDAHTDDLYYEPNKKSRRQRRTVPDSTAKQNTENIRIKDSISPTDSVSSTSQSRRQRKIDKNALFVQKSRPMNTLAVASALLGVSGFVVLYFFFTGGSAAIFFLSPALSLLALILGAIAVRQIKKSRVLSALGVKQFGKSNKKDQIISKRKEQQGLGLAVLGAALGAVCLLFSAYLLLLLIAFGAI